MRLDIRLSFLVMHPSVVQFPRPPIMNKIVCFKQTALFYCTRMYVQVEIPLHMFTWPFSHFLVPSILVYIYHNSHLTCISEVPTDTVISGIILLQKDILFVFNSIALHIMDDHTLLEIMKIN